MTYLKPAHMGKPLFIAAVIAHETKAWRPIIVETEARDQANMLLAKGHFKVVPLSPERLMEIAGLKQLPESWKQMLCHHAD